MKKKQNIVNLLISLYLQKMNNEKKLNIRMIIFRIFIVPVTFTFNLKIPGGN